MNSQFFRFFFLMVLVRMLHASEPWVDWARNPITVPVTVVATNIYAQTNTPVTVTLSDGSVTRNGLGCNNQTNAPSFVANMKVRREYTLTVVATNLTSLDLIFAYQARWSPIGRGGRAIQPKVLRFLVDRVVDDSGVISITGNGCAAYSNTWTIELTERLPMNVRYEDGTDDPTPSAGDARWAKLGPGKSLDVRKAGIDWSVALGRLMDGQSAGRLTLRENELLPEIYTPTNIFYSAPNELVRDQVELIPKAPGSPVLRQIKAFQAFVDIIPLTNATDLRFYLLSQVSTNTNSFGLYTITGDPFVIHTLSNPEPSTTNKLNIKESRNGSTWTNQIVCSPSSTNATWTLRYGQGDEEHIETRGVWIATGGATNRLEVVTIKSGTNAPAYKCTETYKLFPWGFETSEIRIDPDGTIGNSDDLVTTLKFYDDSNDTYSYAKLSSIKYPDGYWEKRVYVTNLVDEEFGDTAKYLGALDRLYYPWLSNQSDPEAGFASDAVFKDFFYNLSNGEITSDLFRSDNNWINMDVMYRDPDFWVFPGSGLEISKNGMDKTGTATVGGMIGYVGVSPDDTWGFGYYGHTMFERRRGRLFETSYCLGGTLDTTNTIFTPSGNPIWQGPDWSRSVIYHGPDILDGGATALHPTEFEGQPLYSEYGFLDIYPNRNKHESSVYHNGNLALKQLSILTLDTNSALVADLVCKWVYEYDSLGRLTNTVWIDGTDSNIKRTIYSASYRDANDKDGELKKWEQDETGIKRYFTYDSLKRLSTFVKEGFAGQSSITNLVWYDAQDRVITNKTSAAGPVSTTQITTYDIAGRVSSNLATNGLVTTTTYSSGGRIESVTRPDSTTEVTERHYDRKVKSRTGTFGVNEYHSWTNSNFVLPNFAMDVPIHHAIRLTSASSPRFSFEGYDAYNQVAYTAQPDWSTNEFMWEARWFTSPHPEGPGYVRTSMRPWMDTPRFYYDIDGQAALVSMPAPGDPTSWEETTARVEGKIAGYLKENGDWFQTVTNYVLRVNDSLDRTMVNATKVRLNGFGASNVISEETTYDADTNATTIIKQVDQPNRTVTEITMADKSELPATNVIVNGLLSRSSTLSISTPDYYGYDGLGRKTSVTNSLGFISYIVYDSYGRPVLTKDAAGSVTEVSYVSGGTVGAGQVSWSSRNGKKTYFEYSVFGVKRVWGDVPYPEERIYNSYGEMTELRTFKGGTAWSNSTWPGSGVSSNATKWIYDEPSGLLSHKIDADNKTNSYTYFQRLLVTETRARGVIATNEYNDLGELIARYFSDSTPRVAMTNTSVVDFSRTGKPLFVHDGTGDWRLEYDFADRLTAAACTNGNFSGITISNRFNKVHGKDRVRIEGPAQAVDTTYTFDDWGRIETATSGTASASYEYLTGSDLLAKTTYKSNGVTKLTTAREWEFGQRLRSIANTSGGSSVSAHTYSHDGSGRRRSATLEDNSAWSYDYNDRDELTRGVRYWADGSPVAGQHFSYAFDNIGNRSSAKLGGGANGENLRTITYTTGAANGYPTVATPGYKQVVGVALAGNSVTVNSATANRKGEYFQYELSVANSSPVWQGVSVVSAGTTKSGSFVFPKSSQTNSYDADGNLTFDGVWTYEWDAENQLVQMTMTNVTSVPNAERKKIAFGYDHQGRRATKKVYLWTGSAFSGSASVDVRFVYDGWNLQCELNSGNGVIRRYAWGVDAGGHISSMEGVGGLVSIYDGTSDYFPAYDGGGNIAGLIKSDGSLSARYEYGPFGESIRSNGALAAANPFRFSTRFTDDESGLIYYGHRYYNPALGIWMSRDPAEEEGGLNLYSFVNNSPIMLFDVDGRFPSSPNGWIGAAALATTIQLAFMGSNMKGGGVWADRAEAAAIIQTITLNSMLNGALLKNIGGAVGFTALEGAGYGMGKKGDTDWKLGKYSGTLQLRRQSWGMAVLSGRLQAVQQLGLAAFASQSNNGLVQKYLGADNRAATALALSYMENATKGDTAMASLDAALLAAQMTYDKFNTPVGIVMTGIGIGTALIRRDAAGVAAHLPNYFLLNAWDMLDEMIDDFHP